jgi:hypothetical protein
VTVEWAVTSNQDPTVFTIELHHESFRADFAIANTVDASLFSLTITLPVVPTADGYTLRLVNVGNISDIYAESASFSIAGVATSSTRSSTGSGTSGTGTGTSSRTTSIPTTTSIRPTTSVTTTNPTTTDDGGFNADDSSAASIRISVAGFLAGIAAVAAIAL